MEKWIILIMQEAKYFEPPFYIENLDQLVVCDDEGRLMLFDSIEEASEYQDKHAINGQCVELPIY